MLISGLPAKPIRKSSSARDHSPQIMSNKRALSIFGILIGAVLLAGYWMVVRAPISLGDTKSVEDRAVFYRLIAKYQHGDEIVDFDVVVGCAVRVTRYGDGDRSYDAFRDPTVYAKATKDGGVVWQIVPHACQGETSENGGVPKDFLPGAIWFEDVTDFSLGIAYVTEDAYESPSSELKFLGSSIHEATRAEWEAFQPIASKNLIEPRVFTELGTWPAEREVKANLWNRAKLNEWWLPSFGCHGVIRYELTSEAARAFLRTLWPHSRPKFWMPSRAQYRDFLRNPDVKGPTAIDGHQLRDTVHFGHNQTQGYPTRRRGGMLRSGQTWSKFPPTIFPMMADEGIPWVGPEIVNSSTIYRDIDIEEGSKGFAYCYSHLVGNGVAGDLHIPNYRKKTFLTRVDGELISGEEKDDTSPGERPRAFFQNDRYYYERFSFGLN
jgi:hypothetical protein